MPLPDERKGSRASDLIKRFQSQVDSSQETPLIPSNSFASPGKPRLSAPTALPKPQLAPSPAIAPSPITVKKEEEKQTLAELAQEKGRDLQQERDGEKDGSKAVFLRGAGLSSPPAPAESEAESPAPTETEAEEDTSAFVEVNPPSPTVARREHLPPIVTSPSIDVPPDNVPGSTSLLASPNLTPSNSGRHSRSISVESLTPHSPVSPGREGLSQPSSPATESGRLSAPPVRDDSSPPPPPPQFESPPSMGHAFPLEPLAAPDSPSPSPKQEEQEEEPSIAEVEPEPESNEAESEQTPSTSPSKSRPTPRTQGSLSTPTASFLAKTRPRVSSTATPSPSSSPSRPRSSISNTSSSKPTAAASSARMSPSSSRTSATSSVGGGRSSVVSPSLSASSSRRRASSIGSTISNGTSTPSRAGGATPRKAVPTTGTPRSRKAAAEAAATAAAAGEGAEQEKPTRKHTPLKSATPKASTLVRKTSPEVMRMAGGSSGEQSGGSGVPAREGKSLRMANRGRIGLAGAGMNRKKAEGTEEREGEKDKGEKEGEEDQDTPTEDAPPALDEQDDIPSIPSDPEEDAAPPPTEKVFKGFGSRPMGRIPIPVEEDGEGGMRAVGAEDVEKAGHEEGEGKQ